MGAGTRTIALLVDCLVSNYQVTLLRAVEHTACQHGVSLLTLVGRPLASPLFGDATQNRVYDLVESSGVDGIILVAGCLTPFSGSKALQDYCRRHGSVPLFSVGVCLDGIPSLVVDNRSGTYALVEHLVLKHGARRIAFIGGPELNDEATERYEGYVEALTAHGLEPDDRLFVRGGFTVPTGLDATRELFARGAAFDAIVAANDYMAIAALDVVRERGLSVPQDLLLAGFDDAPFSRFALPSLTTVRQPLERLGRMAVDSLLQIMDGALLPKRMHANVELVTRQSCGCGHAWAPPLSQLPRAPTRVGAVEALSRRRTALVTALYEAVGVPPDSLGGWAIRLVDGLEDELSGEKGSFLAELHAVLEEAQHYADFVDELHKVVGLLRAEVYGLRPPQQLALELEQVWHEAQLAVGNAAINAQGRTKLELQVVLDNISTGFERIATAFTLPALKQAIEATLPALHVRRAFVGLAETAPEALTPLLTLPEALEHETTPGEPMQVRFVPENFFPPERHSHIVLPLSWEDDWFGVAVLEYTSNETVYALLRDQVSSALKGGALLRAAVTRATARHGFVPDSDPPAAPLRAGHRAS